MNAFFTDDIMVFKTVAVSGSPKGKRTCDTELWHSLCFPECLVSVPIHLV
jgi:hypothetical protein